MLIRHLTEMGQIIDIYVPMHVQVRLIPALISYFVGFIF